jgi:hypothetical protein
LYKQNRHLTNFAHFHNESLVEQDPQTVRVRKYLDRAKQLQKLQAAHLEALEVYCRPQAKELAKYPEPRTIEAWKDILLKNPEYRRDVSFVVQEETLRFQQDYLRVAVPAYVKPLAPLLHGMAQATRQPPAPPDQLFASVLTLHSLVQAKRAAEKGRVAEKDPSQPFDWLPLKLAVNERQIFDVKGPFDIDVEDERSPGLKVPLISAEARRRLQRFGPPAPGGAATRPPSPPQPPGR